MSHERLRAFQETTNKPEHLAEGFSPIFTTVQSNENVSEEDRTELNKRINKESTTFVQYAHHSPEWLQKRDVIQHSDNVEEFWLMSTVDSKDKFSKDYRSCLGLAVIGVDHEGNRISFLTHTNPLVFADQKSFDEYTASLRGNLIEMKNRCQIGSIDAVSFGGRITWDEDLPGEIDPEQTYADDYQIATEITANLVNDVLDFKPIIAEGPRLKRGYDFQQLQQLAFLDTENNHLHIIVRGAAPNSGRSFSVDGLTEELQALKPLKTEVNRDLE